MVPVRVVRGAGRQTTPAAARHPHQHHATGGHASLPPPFHHSRQTVLDAQHTAWLPLSHGCFQQQERPNTHYCFQPPTPRPSTTGGSPQQVTAWLSPANAYRQSLNTHTTGHGSGGPRYTPVSADGQLLPTVLLPRHTVLPGWQQHAHPFAPGNCHTSQVVPPVRCLVTLIAPSYQLAHLLPVLLLLLAVGVA
jgi:hypothetical protein